MNHINEKKKRPDTEPFDVHFLMILVLGVIPVGLLFPRSFWQHAPLVGPLICLCLEIGVYFGIKERIKKKVEYMEYVTYCQIMLIMSALFIWIIKSFFLAV